MADKYRKPCFDSSVFLGGLNEEIKDGIKRGIVFRYLWDRAKDGEFQVLISALAIAETFKKKNRPHSGAPVLDEFLQCINEPFVEVIEIDRETALQAHQLCRRYAAEKLMPNDAIHLACAIRAGCDVLLSWNGPLAILHHDSIRIESPQIYDKELFTVSEIATPEEIKAYEERIVKEEKANSGSSKIQGSGGGSAPTKTSVEEIPKAAVATASEVKEEPKSSMDSGSSPKA